MIHFLEFRVDDVITGPGALAFAAVLSCRAPSTALLPARRSTLRGGMELGHRLRERGRGLANPVGVVSLHRGLHRGDGLLHRSARAFADASPLFTQLLFSRVNSGVGLVSRLDSFAAAFVGFRVLLGFT